MVNERLESRCVAILVVNRRLWIVLGPFYLAMPIAMFLFGEPRLAGVVWMFAAACGLLYGWRRPRGRMTELPGFVANGLITALLVNEAVAGAFEDRLVSLLLVVAVLSLHGLPGLCQAFLWHREDRVRLSVREERMKEVELTRCRALMGVNKIMSLFLGPTSVVISVAGYVHHGGFEPSVLLTAAIGCSGTLYGWTRRSGAFWTTMGVTANCLMMYLVATELVESGPEGHDVVAIVVAVPFMLIFLAAPTICQLTALIRRPAETARVDDPQ